MSRFRTLAISIAVSLSLGLAGIAAAQQVRTWKDADGRLHYSNVSPSSPPPPAGASPPSAPAAEANEPAAAETPAEKVDPYGKLSDGELSSTVTLKRDRLQNELRTAQRRIAEIDQELADIRGLRQKAMSKAAEAYGIDRAPADVPSPRELELSEEKKKLEEQVASVRSAYAELEDSVRKRNAGLPQWWIPLER
ncbi:MAG: hypothetical protein QOD06_691 [Candidatus Binatota bacterium]|jgi:hypothetical protein|nr:hypothetical protein [Candidatus Binatota bacterium]